MMIDDNTTDTMASEFELLLTYPSVFSMLSFNQAFVVKFLQQHLNFPAVLPKNNTTEG